MRACALFSLQSRTAKPETIVKSSSLVFSLSLDCLQQQAPYSAQPRSRQQPSTNLSRATALQPEAPKEKKQKRIFAEIFMCSPILAVRGRIFSDIKSAAGTDSSISFDFIFNEKHYLAWDYTLRICTMKVRG